MILLDSDVVIDFLRGYQPALDWLIALNDEEIILPGFVVMELIQGCRDAVEQKYLEKAIGQFRHVWPTAEDGEEALSRFSNLYLSHGIGILDCLIGQTAISLQLPLYTFNQKHYAVLDNLETVKPYKK